MRCDYCNRELPAETHGKRAYCNDAHKQAHYRQHVQNDLHEYADLRAELARLQAQVEQQEQELAQHRRVIIDLKRQLDLEYLYLMDTQARGFLSFLKQRPATPFIEKVLADTRLQLQPTGSRWMYEAYLRDHHLMTEEEEHEFKDLWKLLLLKPIRDDL